MTTQQEIERLVNKYPWGDSKELFKTELEYLVALAEKEQMIRDQEATIKLTTQDIKWVEDEEIIAGVDFKPVLDKLDELISEVNKWKDSK